MIDFEKVRERIRSAKDLMESIELLQDEKTKEAVITAVVDLLQTAAQDLKPVVDQTGGEDDE